MGIISCFYILFFTTTLIHGQVDYDDSYILEGLNPDMFEGVNGIMYIEHPLYDKFPVGYFHVLGGSYSPYIAIIRINVDRNEEEVKSTLCHEICHHQWYEHFTQEDRDYWNERYLEWRDSDYEGVYRKYIFDGNELHSYWCGENYVRACYS